MFLYSIRGIKGKLKYCPVVASARVKVLQIETDSAISICMAGYVMYATSSSRAAIPSKLSQKVFQNWAGGFTKRDYCPVLEHPTGKRKTFTIREGFLLFLVTPVMVFQNLFFA